MNVEVTATTSSIYQLPADQVIVAPVSAYDPDRDSGQPHSSSLSSFSEPQSRTIRVRPNVAESFWITREQIHQIRQLDRLGSSTTGRSATIIVHASPEGMVDVLPDTSTGYSTVPGVRYGFDPRSKYIADFEEKNSVSRQVRQAYKARIDKLRSGAALDGFEVNGASEKDFWSFIGSSGFSRRAGLALMDNGNLRAVWKREDASHLGLHFLGERQVQYVIFKRRSGSRKISRTAGIDTFEGVKKQILAFDLLPLVNA